MGWLEGWTGENFGNGDATLENENKMNSAMEDFFRVV